METREDVGAMLKEDALIDLIIPRGSNAFVRWIMDNSRIPVLGHADGICHVYVDKDADLEMALRVAVDSKTQNVSVCNAMETLLVHRDVAEAFLPPLAQAMGAKGVQLRGDEATRASDCLRPGHRGGLGHGISGPDPVDSRGGLPGGGHRPYQPPWLPPYGLHCDWE